MAFSNLFAFLSGVGSFCFGKTRGALGCLKILGEIKRAISSDKLISLVTSEMFFEVIKSIVIMLLTAVIAVIGVAIIKNGQNELPKMKQSGDSFFKRVLRLFLIALIVPVIAISGIGVDGNVRKNASAYDIYPSKVDTDLYRATFSFNQAIYENFQKEYVQIEIYKELFEEGKKITFYINSDGKEVVFDSNRNCEVDNSFQNKIYYGNAGEGRKKYERACLESTAYEVIIGFGGDYAEKGNTVSGFFVKIPSYGIYLREYKGGFQRAQISFNKLYFFVEANNNNKEAYYYYLTKHIGLDIVSCDFNTTRHNCNFELYFNSNYSYKADTSVNGTYYIASTPYTQLSGLMGFISKTKEPVTGSDYGAVEDFTDKEGKTTKGCYYTFGPKGLMAEGGFFENEKDAPNKCEVYINDLSNDNNPKYFTARDYDNKSLSYSNVGYYTSSGADISENLIYNNWNTVNYAMQLTKEMPTGGSGRKVRDPLTEAQIEEYYAHANGGNEQGSSNGNGQSNGSVSDAELNEKVDKTAVAVYKRIIGIINTILPFVIGFVLALAMFYGLNIALRYARADEIEDKKKAKQKLINIVVGAIIAIVLTSIIILILNGDFIINIIESMK